MTASYYDVALPVPLRQTFTYAVPGALTRDVVPGCRVVVPFRRKAMIGVALEKRDRAPNVGEIREIVETLDPLPALTPQLIELGRWIAGYYLAPVCEVFRTMLPPTVEVRAERLLILTGAGRDYLREIASLTNRSAAGG